MALSAEQLSSNRRDGKSATAFRTISEVAGALDLPQHVLRFWESKFPQIKPMKRGGGRRYYRPEDVDLLRRIRALLYADGYTIRGVQKLMRETGGKTPDAGPVPEPAAQAPARSASKFGERGKEILAELETLRDMLRGRIPSQ